MGRGAGEPPGRWLRRVREEQGLSQEELAARSGLSVRSISGLECGRTRPHPRSVRLLAGALGLPQAAADELVVLYRTGRGLAAGPGLSQARYSTAATVPDTSDEGRATPGGLAAPAPRQLPAVARGPDRSGLCAGTPMWIGLLGSLLVRVDGAAVAVPAARQRALLAVLAVRAGELVSTDELAETVWDGMDRARFGGHPA